MSDSRMKVTIRKMTKKRSKYKEICNTAVEASIQEMRERTAALSDALDCAAKRNSRVIALVNEAGNPFASDFLPVNYFSNSNVNQPLVPASPLITTGIFARGVTTNNQPAVQPIESGMIDVTSDYLKWYLDTFCMSDMAYDNAFYWEGIEEEQACYHI